MLPFRGEWEYDVNILISYVPQENQLQAWAGITFWILGREQENQKKLSRCSGRKREIQETIPVVWDGNGKYKKPFP